MEAKIVLDTDFLVDFLRNDRAAADRMRELSDEHELCTTDINLFELYYGAYLSRRTAKNLASVNGIARALTVFSTGNDSMETSGKLLAALDKRGRKIGIKDVLIAGICLVHSCPIMTYNKKHFKRLGVDIAD